MSEHLWLIWLSLFFCNLVHKGLGRQKPWPPSTQSVIRYIMTEQAWNLRRVWTLPRSKSGLRTLLRGVLPAVDFVYCQAPHTDASWCLCTPSYISCWFYTTVWACITKPCGSYFIPSKADAPTWGTSFLPLESLCPVIQIIFMGKHPQKPNPVFLYWCCSSTPSQCWEEQHSCALDSWWK